MCSDERLRDVARRAGGTTGARTHEQEQRGTGTRQAAGTVDMNTLHLYVAKVRCYYNTGDGEGMGNKLFFIVYAC